MTTKERAWEEWWREYDEEQSSIRCCTPNREDCEEAFLAGLAAGEQRGIVNGLEMAAELSASFINCEMGCADVITHAIRAKAEEVK